MSSQLLQVINFFISAIIVIYGLNIQRNPRPRLICRLFPLTQPYQARFFILFFSLLLYFRSFLKNKKISFVIKIWQKIILISMVFFLVGIGETNNILFLGLPTLKIHCENEKLRKNVPDIKQR